MSIFNYKIINVYKATPLEVTLMAVPIFPQPFLYIDDFNCQHIEWGTNTTNDNKVCLNTWAAPSNLSLLYNPKGPANFLSGHWATETNPDMASASTNKIE